MVHGSPHQGVHALWRPWPARREGKIVEADETYFGPVTSKAKLTAHVSPQRLKARKSGRPYNRPIIGLVERGGRVRTFHVAGC